MTSSSDLVSEDRACVNDPYRKVGWKRPLFFGKLDFGLGERSLGEALTRGSP